MATRTDVHRPSEVNPADYDFVGFDCLRVDDIGDAMFLQQERARIRAHMERTGGERSRHEHGGNCHICGSVNAIYTAMFHHKPSNTYIRTGLECADKLECHGVEAFRRNVADFRKNAAGKAKAQLTLADAGLSTAWDVYTAEGGKSEEGIIRDIVGKLVKYGSISPAQTSFIGKLLDKIANRAEREVARQVEMESAKPIPVTDKRVTIRGKVLSIKRPDWASDQNFLVTRILVQHEDGWKIFGSLPSSIADVERGAIVEFDAKIKPKDGDPKFGFFSRPTKAIIVLPAG